MKKTILNARLSEDDLTFLDGLKRAGEDRTSALRRALTYARAEEQERNKALEEIKALIDKHKIDRAELFDLATELKAAKHLALSNLYAAARALPSRKLRPLIAEHRRTYALIDKTQSDNVV